MSISRTAARTRKDPVQRAAEIRDAARCIAVEDGLSALTLRAIAQRAGVAPGLVAHYSPGMDELTADVFADLAGAELERVRAGFAASADPADALAGLFRTTVGGADDISRVWVDAWSLGGRNAHLSAAIDALMQGWNDAVAQVLRTGVAHGLFHLEDPDAAAAALIALIDGLSAHALVRGTDPAPFVARLARIGERLVGATPGTISAHLRR